MVTEKRKQSHSCVYNLRLTPDVDPESHNIQNGQVIVQNYTKYKNQKNVNNKEKDNRHYSKMTHVGIMRLVLQQCFKSVIILEWKLQNSQQENK